jgi:hypothetical protein
MGTPCTPYSRGLTLDNNNKIYVREQLGVEWLWWDWEVSRRRG